MKFFIEKFIKTGFLDMWGQNIFFPNISLILNYPNQFNKGGLNYKQQ